MSNKFLYLSEVDVHNLINHNYSIAIDAVRNALLMKAHGTTIQPFKSSQILNEEHQNRINCMASTLKEIDTSGVKWVSVFPTNKALGLSNVEGITILSETLTGKVKCIMNATELTSVRTAAVGALAAKHLARQDAETIGFIGAGEEARAHFKLIKYVLKDIQKCFVSSRTNSGIKAFIDELAEEYPDVEFINCHNHYHEAILNADVIVTAISSQDPVLKANWIKNGALYIHVAGVEDEFAVAKKATKIVCDSWECVKHRSQTILQMYKAGELKESDIYGDIDEIIEGKKPGRENDREFIYFNSVGLSILDIMLSNQIYEMALRYGLGTWITK